MVSAGKGSRRCLFPLPSTRSCALGQMRSSSRRSRVSWERRPLSNIKATKREIPRGTKAAPEPGDLIGGERHNQALWLLEPKPGGHDAVWAAVTERGSGAIENAGSGTTLRAVDVRNESDTESGARRGDG